jgi:hypothetical protein
VRPFLRGRKRIFGALARVSCIIRSETSEFSSGMVMGVNPRILFFTSFTTDEILFYLQRSGVVILGLSESGDKDSDTYSDDSYRNDV